MLYDVLSEEVKRALRYQIYVMVLNFILVTSIIVAIDLNYFIEQSLWLIIPISGIVGIVVYKWLNSVAWSILSSRISEKAALELIKQVEDHLEGQDEHLDPEQHQVNLLITNRPEEPIGFFKDSPIYEWVDINIGDNASRRFEFVGTHDSDSGHLSVIPDLCVLLAPGILYKLKEE